MIAYVQGSLFLSPARVLVNTVNTVGVMGKGIAKTFRDIYPEMFEVYKRACDQKDLRPGGLLLYPTPHKTILNFPTKRHWRQPARMDDIEAGLKTFAASYSDFGLSSVAFPLLGCGNGGLDWEQQVRPLMERYLRPLPIDVYIHLPEARGGPTSSSGRDEAGIKAWLRGEPIPLAFAEFWHDLLRCATEPASPGDLDEWRPWLDDGDSPPTLVFERGETTASLTREDLFRLFQLATGFGLLAPTDLPDDIRPAVPALFGLLARLPYFAPVVWAMDLSEMDRVGSRGLRYAVRTDAPLAALRQQPLFDEAAVA